VPPLPYTPQEILNDPDYQEGIATHFIVASNVYWRCFSHRKHVWLSEQILFEAIASCYCDIYRLQVFRGISQEDVHKRTAFLMKWINKFRPIQIASGTYTDKHSVILANEIFAVEVAMVLLNIPPDELFSNSRTNVYARNMVYLLRNHSCNAEQLASEIFLLERHACSKWSAM